MKRERGERKVGPLCLFAIFCLFGFTIFADGQVPNNSLRLSARPIVVNTTADVSDFTGAQQVGDLPGPDGLVSLREAITAANNTPGAHWIAFRIPKRDPGFDGSVFTIRPFEQLPAISGEGLAIDGSTQTLFSGNTNKLGPEIVLDGALLNPEDEPWGLTITSADNRVHSLVIHTFAVNIEISGPLAVRNAVTGSFVGTDAAGTVALPYSLCATRFCVGITSRFGASHNTIGGPHPSDHNLVSGNGTGVFVENTGYSGATTGNTILGNLIGTDRTGTRAISNNNGVMIKCGTTNTMITNNVIAFNTDWGIILNDTDPPNCPFSLGNTISRNSIFANLREGIVLIGCTGNDPGDTDIGTNGCMNYPVLTSARRMLGGLTVKGMIDTQNPETVTIEFFANPVPFPGGDSTGRGEGAIYLGKKRPDSAGAFSVVLPPVPVGTLISATATDAGGNTSEFALNVAVTR